MKFELFIPYASVKFYYAEDAEEVQNHLDGYSWLVVTDLVDDPVSIRTSAVTHFRIAEIQDEDLCEVAEVRFGDLG